MDTQAEIIEAKVDNAVEQQQQQQVITTDDGVKVEKLVKGNSSPPMLTPAATAQDMIQPPTTMPTTVIATRQRMITTQGHIREISVAQGQEVPEQYEQYQLTASGDDQNVYTYEQTPGGLIISNQPENLQATQILKRDILLEKEHNGNPGGPTINVVNTEAQTVYVELKNDNLEQARYLQNATIRYESADRYHRFAYHGLPPHNAAHIAHHQRELALKAESGHQTPQEIQIYEAEQGAQSHQQSNQQSDQGSINEQQNEPKTHYTNLEPVGSSQNSYYISSESYQPANSNGFAYLPTPVSKEGSYVYHPGSPVLYKSKYFNRICTCFIVFYCTSQHHFLIPHS